MCYMVPFTWSAVVRIRKFGTGAIAATLHLGCGRSEQMSSSTAPEEARHVVEALYAAWSLHDPERIDAVFTDDAAYEDVAGGQVHRGKTEIKQLLGAAFTFAPDFSVTVRSLVVGG